METAKEWVAENAHGRALATYAPVLGVSESTFWRKYYKNKFTADDIIALARENRINPVQALRECGKPTEQETQKLSTIQTLKTASARLLADELVARATK